MPRGASLPEVLKAIYLQQHFAEFVVDTQGVGPAALHAAFGDFLQAHRPGDIAAPTQAPGLIRLPERPLPQGASA
jgi:hypothetical protein